MNVHSQARLAEVIPALAEKIERLAALCEADMAFTSENATLEVTQGIRTWPEQDALYAEGRTTPGREVTNAQAGQSWHNYGCAVDVAPFINGQQPDWDESHPVWARIVALGESLGLRSGVSWKDEPHFEHTGNYPANPPQEVKDLYASGGTQAVWAAINAAQS